MPLATAAAVAALAAPCLLLAFDRGGVPVATQTAACAWIFLLLGARAAAPRGAPLQIGPLLAALIGWTLFQLLPLPVSLLGWLSPERAREIADFGALGLAAPSTLSLYPYATARALVVLAAAAALYWLARDLTRRSPGAWRWLAAAVLILGLAEALPALRQYFLIQTGSAALPFPADYARGTFGNRNLLAAWLVGCYSAALGMAAAPLDLRLRALGAVTGALTGVAVLATFSRMGLLALGAATLLFGCAGGLGRRRWRIPAAAAALALGAALAIGPPALARRYSQPALQAEREGRLAMWADAAGAARRYWLTGAGAGAFPWAFRRSHPYLAIYTIDHPHNEYLEAAAEWGVPAAALTGAALALWMARRLVELRRAPSPAREIGLGCWSGAAAVLLHAAVDFPLRLPAILFLFALLAGLAAGGPSPAPRRVPAPAVAVAAAALAGVSLWSLPGGAEPAGMERFNAELPYRGARLAFEQDDRAGAERALGRTLALNPYAAQAWMEAAALAEARGQPGVALDFARLAQQLEPYTRRGQWAGAHLRLRLGDLDGALALFGSLARHQTGLRRAAWESLWRGAVPPDRILDETVVPDAFEDYLGFLTSNRRWLPAVEAWQREGASLDARLLGPLFEELHSAGQLPLVERLWSLAAPQETLFANPDLSRPLRGWGLDWRVWPVDGVRVERRAEEQGFRLDVEFGRPQNLLYTGVAHDFAVTPGRDYVLQLEARAEAITSSTGVQIEIRSLGRALGITPPLARSTGWRHFELRFRPRAGEQILRLRVLRPLSNRFDSQLTGRFSLRRLRLSPPR